MPTITLRNTFKKLTNLALLLGMLISPLTFPIHALSAQTQNPINQTIEFCFITLDQERNYLTTLPDDTGFELQLYTDAGHLQEGQINGYGSEFISISQSSKAANRDLLGSDGLADSYCALSEFTNPANHEYTYTQVVQTSDQEWLPPRYNDQDNITFVDPDVAFTYSPEWFDDVAGNESLRSTDADGHLIVTAARPHRRIIIVNQLDQNLSDYGVNFSDSTPTSQEYTLSTIPDTLNPEQTIDLRFSVQNIGSLLWLPGDNPANVHPVNVSYHWKNKDTGDYVVYDGNRAFINHEVAYTQNDSNIALQVDVPGAPGNYELIIDLVHEGVTWFSAQGTNTFVAPVTIKSSSEPLAEITPQANLIMPQATLKVASGGSYYTVKPYQGGNWHCGGYDCLTGIAEDYYQCSAKGIPNNVSTGDVTKKCWWPIYEANQHLYTSVPPAYKSAPWNYIQVGWVLYIPPWEDGPVNPPINSSNFGGIKGATTTDPYAGMNGAYSAWTKVTFDRFIAWDGSYKTDQIKWSETQRPQAPTITGIQTSNDGSTATIYGVAIPKNHPMHVAVWNEFRYCWACGSGWEYKYQQGTAQHVKVVLFKNNWEYIGQVWNDRSDGKWNITLPLGSALKPGDKVFAEVQVEADYTFSGLKWWSDTYETVNFNLRNPKYTGYPYFGSGGGNSVAVPSVYVDKRSAEEKKIDQLATALGSTGGSSLTNICGKPAKTYTKVTPGESASAGAIIFINGKAIYTYGGTWDTFNFYNDKCSRFGVPINNPYLGGAGPFNTPGAYQDFQKGRIYWSWKYAGKFTYGTIWNKFEQAGGTNSYYGWPTSEVYQATENSSTLNCQNFEGGRICDGEFTPYSAAQQALKPVLGRYPDVSEMSNFCGGMQKVAIPGGIAYYDPNYKNVRKVTGAIYNTWGEDCKTYGLPENNTTSATGFGGATGQAQRFNLSNKQFDFYQKGNGAVVILEGEVKNKYDSKGGLGRLGFMQNSYNSPRSAAGRCDSTGLFWNLDNGRIYKNGNSLWVVYADTPIGKHFFSNGADSVFGLPMNDETTSGLYSWQDFIVTRLELWWPNGVVESRGTEHCPGEEPGANQPLALIEPIKGEFSADEPIKFRLQSGTNTTFVLDVATDINLFDCENCEKNRYNYYQSNVGDTKLSGTVLDPKIAWNKEVTLPSDLKVLKHDWGLGQENRTIYYRLRTYGLDKEDMKQTKIRSITKWTQEDKPIHPVLEPACGNYDISSPFGPRVFRLPDGTWYSDIHDGVDIVSSSSDCIVNTVFKGTRSNQWYYGNTTFVEHNDRFITGYGHTDEYINLNKAMVDTGDPLMKIGCSGLCTGPHLHFVVIENGVHVNPEIYFEI